VHEVQIRTPLASNICKIFQKQDQVVVSLQMLAWNNEVEFSAIDDQEFRIKREVRDLATFIARTLRGMRNKAAPKEPVAAAPAASAFQEPEQVAA
jgi:hypothetical protein